jgi:Zn-dependent peptidase ImmA (M78 family)
MRQIISTSLAQQAISKAVYTKNQILTGNRLGPNAERPSTNKLLEFCRNFLDKDIRLLEHCDSYHNHKVYSFCVKHDEYFDIVYLRELNNCWMRFVLCKELFHVILDDPSNCNSNVAEHVDSLFAISLSDGSQDRPNSTQIETAAEIAAMEYLFPYSERQRLQNQPQIDYMAIARQFLVPRVYVEIYLGQATMSVLGALDYASQ